MVPLSTCRRIFELGTFLLLFLMLVSYQQAHGATVGTSSDINSSKREPQETITTDPKFNVSDFLSSVERQVQYVNYVFYGVVTIIGLGFGLGGVLLFRDVKTLRDDNREAVRTAKIEIDYARNELVNAKQMLEQQENIVRESLTKLDEAKKNLPQEILLAVNLSHCLTSHAVGGAVDSVVNGNYHDLSQLKALLKPTASSYLEKTLTYAQRVREVVSYDAPNIPCKNDLLPYCSSLIYEAAAHKRLKQIRAALRLLEEYGLPLESILRERSKPHLAPIFYNAACYRCVLLQSEDDKKKVLEYLEKAFELNKGFRNRAQQDPDLYKIKNDSEFKHGRRMNYPRSDTKAADNWCRL